MMVAGGWRIHHQMKRTEQLHNMEAVSVLGSRGIYKAAVQSSTWVSTACG